MKWLIQCFSQTIKGAFFTMEEIYGIGLRMHLRLRMSRSKVKD